jgi:hypothetical protein
MLADLVFKAESKLEAAEREVVRLKEQVELLHRVQELEPVSTSRRPEQKLPKPLRELVLAVCTDGMTASDVSKAIQERFGCEVQAKQVANVLCALARAGTLSKSTRGYSSPAYLDYVASPQECQ